MLKVKAPSLRACKHDLVPRSKTVHPHSTFLLTWVSELQQTSSNVGTHLTHPFALCQHDDPSFYLLVSHVYQLAPMELVVSSFLLVWLCGSGQMNTAWWQVSCTGDKEGTLSFYHQLCVAQLNILFVTLSPLSCSCYWFAAFGVWSHGNKWSL